MKTTIDIPDGMLKEIMKNAGTATKREAVLAAIDEYNRKRRQQKLIKHLGTFKNMMSHDELMKMRKMG